MGVCEGLPDMAVVGWACGVFVGQRRTLVLAMSSNGRVYNHAVRLVCRWHGYGIDRWHTCRDNYGVSAHTSQLRHTSLVSCGWRQHLQAAHEVACQFRRFFPQPITNGCVSLSSCDRKCSRELGAVCVAPAIHGERCRYNLGDMTGRLAAGVSSWAGKY